MEAAVCPGMGQGSRTVHGCFTCAAVVVLRSGQRVANVTIRALSSCTRGPAFRRPLERGRSHRPAEPAAACGIVRGVVLAERGRAGPHGGRLREGRTHVARPVGASPARIGGNRTPGRRRDGADAPRHVVRPPDGLRAAGPIHASRRSWPVRGLRRRAAPRSSLRGRFLRCPGRSRSTARDRASGPHGGARS
jgi:hypothetical protein